MSERETTALVVRPNMEVGAALSASEVLAQVHRIQEVMKAAMTENEHYGSIPGTGGKKTLLQPGAQKLTMTFRLAPEYEIQETNLPGGHKEYRIVCTLKSIQTGAFLGQGVGCCSSMESKYRFRQGVRKCPKCGKEAIIKGKADYGGGWLCFGKKGGCGAKWPDGAQEIEGQNVDRVENDNPADTFNTVLKIAKKRAFVDATITATAASDIFTQDIGDSEEDAGSPETQETTTKAPPARKSSPPAKSETTSGDKSVVSGDRQAYFAQILRSSEKFMAASKEDKDKAERFGENCLKRFIAKVTEMGEKAIEVATGMAVECGWILEGENMDDMAPMHAPLNAKEFEKLIASISDAVGASKEKGNNGENEQTITDTHKTGSGGGSNEPPPDVQEAINNNTRPKQNESWRTAIVPIPRKGMRRNDYLRSPDTIGSLFDLRHGNDEESQTARQRLYGLVHSFQPAGWTKQNGQKMPPSDADIKFRKDLDAFAEWWESNHPGENL